MRGPLLVPLLALVSPLTAQQVADTAFTYPNPDPSFPRGEGPVVCVDEAHHNFHRLDGRYFAFGKLLRGDGFRTRAFTEPFSGTELAGCDLLVVANALSEENAVVEGDPDATGRGWARPHPPALGPAEISALLKWLGAGGNLLLVMDHAPFPGAVADLASSIGGIALDGGATYRVFGTLPEPALEEAASLWGMEVDRLREVLGEVGSLGEHPILTGGEGAKPVRTVMTFGGSVFFPSKSIRPLLEPAPSALGLVAAADVPRERWPRFDLTGWIVAGAGQYGEGRIVLLGEAAMCSAQLAGPQRTPMGMNNPLSVDNPRFCLDVMRWLARAL